VVSTDSLPDALEQARAAIASRRADGRAASHPPPHPDALTWDAARTRLSHPAAAAPALADSGAPNEAELLLRLFATARKTMGR
jgi:hypothetical protein